MTSPVDPMISASVIAFDHHQQHEYLATIAELKADIARLQTLTCSADGRGYLSVAEL